MTKRQEERKFDLKGYKAKQREGLLNHFTMIQTVGRKFSKKLVKTTKAVELVMGKGNMFTGKREMMTSVRYEMVA